MQSNDFVSPTVFSVILGVYFALVIAVGVAATFIRKAGVADYFLGSRDVGGYVMVMTLAASWFSVAGFVGIPAFAFLAGPAFLVYGTWNILIAMLIWFIGIRVWLLGRRFNYVTPTQMYIDYYGGRVLPLLVIVTFLLAIIPQALAQLTGAGRSVLGLTNIPYWIGVIAFVGVVGLYTLFGGLRAVVWTDTLQGTLMLALGLFLPISVFIVGGGPTQVFSDIQASQPEVLTYRPEYVASSLSQYLQIGLGFLGMPYIFQRFFIARSPKVIGQSFIGAALVQVWVFATPFVLFGIAANSLYGDGQLSGGADELLTRYFADYFPVLGAVAVAVAFAAGQSTISSVLLTASSIFSIDLYKRYFRPGASEARTKLVSQLFVAAYIVVLVVVALTGVGGTLVQVISAAGFGLALQVIPAMMGPLLWSRITRAGATSGLALGVLITLVVQAAPDLAPFGLLAGAVAFPVNLVVTIVVSVLTKPVPYSTQEEFHGFLESSLYQSALSVRAA